MRVVLARGRVDVEAEATFAKAIGKAPPYYSFPAVLNDLELACRERGWDVHIHSVGKPTLQRVIRPDIVVNLIAEPLVCKRALNRLEALVRENALPILNNVEVVRRSARTVLPGVIGASNAKNVRVPTTTFFSGAPEGLERHMEAARHVWPVLGPYMVGRPETIAAEKDFLASHDALDDRIAELFRIVGLDFGVIDFAVSDSGEITVFELNGTFQISRSIPSEYLARWGYLEANNGAIVEALVAAVARRAQR